MMKSISRNGSGKGDGFANVPISPTDDMMSPVTKQLNLMKRIHSPQEAIIREKRRTSFNFRKAIHPSPFPLPLCEFILGTSSANRKQVIELLQWKFRQMSPNIDGKFNRYYLLCR